MSGLSSAFLDIGPGKIETNGDASDSKNIQCPLDDSKNDPLINNKTETNSMDEQHRQQTTTTTLSPEAAQILDELPLLAFLRKKILPTDTDIS